jgi:hypothetical protein
VIYALDGVEAFFLANLETILLEIEAEETGLTISRWKSLTTYENQSYQFPFIEILPADTGVDYGSETSPLTQHWEIHNIDVEVVAAGQDTDEIKKTLLWYREAIVRLVKLDQTFGKVFNRVRLGRAGYSPIMKSAQEHKLLKFMRQPLECRVSRR